MRGTVERLETARPLGLELPAPYAEDDFVQRFLAGLDDVLAAVYTTLDNVHAYFDADVAPADFLRWLATWVGAELDEDWELERQRALVHRAVALYGQRGTVAALRELLRISTGVDPEIDDTGGVTWSPVPGGQLPGSADARVRVRVRAPGVEQRRVAALVREAVPAHVASDVEVVAG